MSNVNTPAAANNPVEKREMVAIRFAGDSGDGMQLSGNQFTTTTALVGNDLATLPDFPAEIRAPAGTLAGVSGFQIQFGSHEIYTPGDHPDALVAMNPAALKANLPDLRRGAMIFVNSDTFEKRALEKVGFTANPLEDDTLASFRVHQIPITSVTRRALEDTELTTRERDRCRNFFALGLMYWVFGRPLDHTLAWLDQKFAKKAHLAEANKKVLKAGYHYGETTETFSVTYEIEGADIEPGTYRQITGNEASAFGFIAASKLAGADLFLGSYPITPASPVLHELSKHKRFGVRTFQAEDEIAAVSAAIGAAFGGSIALTTTSGPGVSLKSEAIGLAAIVELPLIIANIQRGGPSTGLPTKTEQSDLLQAMFGRNGESPLPIVAPCTPADCFDAAIEAVRISVKYMVPVIYLSDGYIANGAQPWRLPDVDKLPKIDLKYRTETEGFQPYSRDEETLARGWVRPGTPGLEHRVGGLEKSDGPGNVSYDPANHAKMTALRQEKVDRIADDIPDAEICGEDSGELLLVGWGGTYGTLHAATMRLRRKGVNISHMHLRHLNPFPKNVEATLKRFDIVICAELNSGQLKHLLRAKYLVDVQGLNKIQGQPFKIWEVEQRIEAGLAKLRKEAAK